MFSRSALVVAIMLCVTLRALPGAAQDTPGLPLDSLLEANAYTLTLDGTRASGPGYDRLLAAAEGAQFFMIGEEHNLLELNQLGVALFDDLQARHDFQHLVLEQGSVIASWIDEAARSAGLDSVRALVRRYPHAPTFATDEELALMTHVRQRSGAAGPAVWGVDQELSALHILERLAQLVDDPGVRSELLRLADEARPHEEIRTGDVHYLYSVANPEEYRRLETSAGPMADDEARDLMDALQRTVRIYSGQRRADSKYESSREREWSMRARFMERYRDATVGGVVPKALVKMGHFHTLRGFYRLNVLTFGNFLTELAASNDMSTVMVSTHVVGSPDAWRNSGGVFSAVADPGAITVYDLRPLRSLASQGRIAELSTTWHDLIFQAEFALVVGGGRTGSYATAYGTGG